MSKGKIYKYKKQEDGTWIDFQKLVRDSLFDLRLDRQVGGPEVDYFIEQDEKFYGDAKSFGIIIKQLLLNTIKKDNSDGFNSYINLIVRVKESVAVIEVKDEGDEMLARISKRIFQSEQAQKPELIEKGLGLYIVRELVEQLKGTFRIETKKTGENIITLILPQK